MSAGRWSPGPWRINGPSRLRDDSVQILDGEGDTVTHVCADDTMEIGDGSIAEVLSGKAKANARLIAAAPELYEALRDLLHEDGPSRNSWERARSALAKAEGR
jgi:ABC-type transporter lipoprotein component MlaA